MSAKSLLSNLWGPQKRSGMRACTHSRRRSLAAWGAAWGRTLSFLLLVMPSLAHAADENLKIAIGVTPEGASCLLGGSIDGEIVSAATVVPMMDHAQEYTLIELDGFGSMTAAIGLPRPVGSDTDCEDQYEQELALGPDDYGRMQVAVLGSTDVVADHLTESRSLEATEIETLKLDIRVYLDESGFLYTGVEIAQAIEFDANNDGTKDMLINAINSRRENAQRGEYALIMIKDGATGVFTIVAEEFTAETSDYPSLLWENTVVSILDLDGDRQMELVVYGTFYYGDGWEVLKIENGAGSAVLGCGCGG